MATSPPQRPAVDQALKRLLNQAHDSFLALVAPGLIWLGERSPELPAVSRLADLVWDVGGPRDWRGVAHIELQLAGDPAIGERMAEYGIRLWRRDHLPVRSVAVFLRRLATVPRSPFVIDWMGEERLRYAFDVVKLWEIPAERVLESSDPALWPLAGLMANMTPERVIATGERLARAPLPTAERSELTGLLAVLAGLQIPAATIMEALRRNPMLEDLLKYSSVAAALAEEAREQALQQGLERGIQEGRQEGLDQGIRQAAMMALQGRFGVLSEDLRAAIQQADTSTLESVLAHVGTDSLALVRNRLSLS